MDAAGIWVGIFVRSAKRENAEKVVALNCTNERRVNNVSYSSRLDICSFSAFACVCAM